MPAYAFNATVNRARRQAADPCRCAACGQALAGDSGIRFDEETGVLVVDGRSRLFSGQEAAIVGLLFRRMPMLVRHEDIRDAVYQLAAAGDLPEGNAINVRIHRVRAALAGLGLGIENAHGVGRRLVRLREDQDRTHS